MVKGDFLRTCVPVAYAYGGSSLSLYHCQGNSVVESTTENRVVVRSSRTLGTDNSGVL